MGGRCVLAMWLFLHKYIKILSRRNEKYRVLK